MYSWIGENEWNLRECWMNDHKNNPRGIECKGTTANSVAATKIAKEVA